MSDLNGLMQHEVHLAALSFMGAAYILRIVWLLQFKKIEEMSLPAGTGNGAVLQSLLAVAKPWTMEGVRKNPAFYLQFIIFHLGAAAAIGLTFLIPYRPELLKETLFVESLQMVLGAAFIAGLFRLYRRIADRALRLISTPDDYFALITMTLFYALGIGAVSDNPAIVGEQSVLVFFLLAAFFHIYVPFSKIIHYLYYPFTRYYLGKMMEHRNIGREG
ncbi:MAG: hypothetical protein ABFD75_10445 [Smithella sp.]